jgi:FdrA protein
MLAPEVIAAAPNDLVIAIQADDASLVERLLGKMAARLTSTHKIGQAAIYRSVEAAGDANPRSNLVVISVPGAYAAWEAREALERGKHVFVFSDDVPLEQEVELKEVYAYDPAAPQRPGSAGI